MSGIPFLLPDTRSARGPSGTGLRHIWASASQRLNLAADIAHGGRSELASQNTVLGRFHRPEKDMVGMKATPAGLSQPQGLIDKSHNDSDLYTKRTMGFGAEIALIGFWAGLSKVCYDYEVNRHKEMMNYIRDMFGKVESKMDQMDQSIGKLESTMERMDQSIGKLESKMDGNSVYLKVKKGWW